MRTTIDNQITLYTNLINDIEKASKTFNASKEILNGKYL